MDEEQIIADLQDLGLSERTAETVAGWLAEQLAETRAQAVSDAALRVLGVLFDGKREQLRSRAIGMAFAINRSDLAGYLTLDQAAVGEGCSHTMVSNWRKAALEALGGPR